MPITLTWGKLIITGSSFIILASTAIWAMLNYYTRKRFDQHFAEKLESHKGELSKIIDLNKFELQRKMHDFGLYSSKIHEIYPTLYELFMTAQGQVNNLTGLRTMPDYLNMNREQVQLNLVHGYHLPEYVMEDPVIKDLLRDWEHQKENNVKILQGFLNTVQVEEARSALIKAINKYVFSRLYISDEIADIIENLSKNLRLHLLAIANIHDRDFPNDLRRENGEEMRRTNDNIQKLTEELKIKMRHELKVGYYQPTNN